MNKHLGTIIGALLTLAVAGGVFAWDGQRREDGSERTAILLFNQCWDSRVAATGGRDFPECNQIFRDQIAGQPARMTSAALWGAGAGVVFALLFFGVRRMVRKSQPVA